MTTIAPTTNSTNVDSLTSRLDAATITPSSNVSEVEAQDSINPVEVLEKRILGKIENKASVFYREIHLLKIKTNYKKQENLINKLNFILENMELENEIFKCIREKSYLIRNFENIKEKLINFSFKINYNGLTHKQYIDITMEQEFWCISKVCPIWYDAIRHKLVDTFSDKAPNIHHDHGNGFIRGLLSEKVNWVEGGNYGIFTPNFKNILWPTDRLNIRVIYPEWIIQDKICRDILDEIRINDTESYEYIYHKYSQLALDKVEQFRYLHTYKSLKICRNDDYMNKLKECDLISIYYNDFFRKEKLTILGAIKKINKGPKKLISLS